ncbi:helix-turn-helix transcriptional regulator [Clostridium sp. DL1XJH146]
MNLAAYRRFINVSQKEMAKIAGISLTSYNQKELGKKEFTQTQIGKITKFLKEKIPNVTIEEIFFG